MLVVENLSKSFGGLAALNDVSFQVNSGEIVGIVGPNGAGKTTLFEVISGFYRPTRGNVWLDGEQINGLKPHQVRQRGLMRTFQIAEVLTSFTVYDAILLDELFSNPMPRSKRQTEETLSFLGFEHRADELVSVLNVGDRKLLEVGKAIAVKPKVMLLDEPLGGMDLQQIELIMPFIDNACRKNGVSCLIIEHKIGPLLKLADRIIALNFGLKIAEETPDDILKNADVIASYFGDEVDSAESR